MTKTCFYCAVLLLSLGSGMISGCLGSSSTVLTEQKRVIISLNERAVALAELKRDTDAQKMLQEALRLSRSLDDQESQITTLLNLARLDRHEHRQPSATRHIDQALQQSIGGTVQLTDLEQEKALQELAAGRFDQAQQWAEKAVASEQGDLRGRRLNLLARIALLKGNTLEASRQAEQALSANAKDGMEQEKANSLRILGIIKTRDRQFEVAERLLQEALFLDKQLAIPQKIAADLDALAELAVLAKEAGRQQDYLKRAQKVRESMLQQTISW